jgi:hypothetical protein
MPAPSAPTNTCASHCRWRRPALTLLAIIALGLTYLHWMKPAPPPTWVAFTPEERRAGLGRTIDELLLTDVTFHQAIASLASKTGITVDADLPPTDALEVGRAATLHFRQVTVAQALDMMLDEWSIDRDGCTWRVEGGRVRIVMADALDATPTTRVYDVGDLLADAVRTERLLGCPEQVSPHPPGLFITNFTGVPPPIHLERAVREHLQWVVTDTIEGIDSWVHNGGAIGRIGWVGDHLVVTQTAKSHRDIEALLHLLRQSSRAYRTPAETMAVFQHDSRSFHSLASTSSSSDWLLPSPSPVLARRILHLELKNTPLAEAIAHFAAHTASSIIVDWRSLDAAGIKKTALVSAILHDRTLDACLDRVLSGLNRSTTRLAYEVDGAAVRVSTEGALALRQVVRVYDLRSILRDAVAYSRSIAARAGFAPTDGAQHAGHLVLILEQLPRRFGGPNRLGLYWGGRLIVKGSTDDHARVARALDIFASHTPMPPLQTATHPPSLDRVLSEVDLDRLPLDQTLSLLAGRCGAELTVNWRALEAHGFERSAPVTLHLRRPTLGTTLLAVLHHIHKDSDTPLAFRVEAGPALHVSTADELYRRPITRAHDVRDLFQKLLDHLPIPPDGDNLDRPLPGFEGDLAAKLTLLIRERIDPESWTGGGRRATIHYWEGRLIIEQTPENHARIASLLNLLCRDGLPQTGQPSSGQ